MANDLTGDFDVVAEFAIPAVNRLLAAMHSTERFPHSMSIRVDDRPPPGPHHIDPSIVVVVSAFGDPVPNHNQIGSAPSGTATFTNATHFALDHVVNVENLGVFEVERSHLQGRAQLQLSPPSIEVGDAPGTITVHLRIMARYFPDPNTTRVAEFVRGDLSITAPVNQVASQVGNVVEVDIRGTTVQVNFVPQWSSRPLSGADITAINLLIRNALTTSFLPSNTALPSNIAQMQFKTLKALFGLRSAVAVLMKMEGGAGNRDSVHNLFLGSGDAFAFGVGVDFVRAAFQPTIDQILSQPVAPVPADAPWPLGETNYTFTLGRLLSGELVTPSVDLLDGEIVFTVRGSATAPAWWAPNFNFTVKLRFSLEANGDTADLVVGDISFDTSSTIVNWFGGDHTAAIEDARDKAIDQSGARATVRRMLSADQNLGGFLDSLLAPAGSTPTPPTRQFQLAYSSVEIRPSGIVLHGSLAVANWPAPHVEFEQVPVNHDGDPVFGHITVLNQGPDYSALKSWIPGGTIQGYQWKPQGVTQPGFIDENKFVFITPPQLSTGDITVTAGDVTTTPGDVPVTSGDIAVTPVWGFSPLCLTVHGSRLSSSGPVAGQAVTATACAVNSFAITAAGALAGEPLSVALTQPDPRGLVKVAGHTSARVAKAGAATPNLIVHFGDQNSAGKLEFLLQALRDSGRKDASTAVIAVLTPEDLAHARYTPGVTYADDQDGAWERRFDLRITRRPVTIIVAPNGKVAWQREGEIESETLAAALRKLLVAGRSVKVTVKPPALRIGQPPPNFLFEHAPGRQVTLRKIAGRPAILAFWRSSSKESVELVRELEQKNPRSEGPAPIVLAINDGESAESARKVAAENKLSAIVVTDPERRISLAYGVNTWPTIIWIDALGLVRGVRYGNFAGNPDESPFEQTTVASAEEDGMAPTGGKTDGDAGGARNGTGSEKGAYND
jgi:peroxiredoxin